MYVLWNIVMLPNIARCHCSKIFCFEVDSVELSWIFEKTCYMKVMWRRIISLSKMVLLISYSVLPLLGWCWFMDFRRRPSTLLGWELNWPIDGSREWLTGFLRAHMPFLQFGQFGWDTCVSKWSSECRQSSRQRVINRRMGVLFSTAQTLEHSGGWRRIGLCEGDRWAPGWYRELVVSGAVKWQIQFLRFSEINMGNSLNRPCTINLSQ